MYQVSHVVEELFVVDCQSLRLAPRRRRPFYPANKTHSILNLSRLHENCEEIIGETFAQYGTYI